MADDTIPIQSDSFDLNEVGLSCKPDLSNLKNIFNKDISSDINCLKTALQSYVDFVKRKNKNYVSHYELAKFSNRFFPKYSSELGPILELLYNFNHLFFHDSKESMHITNLNHMIDILKILNKEVRSLILHLTPGQNNFERAEIQEDINKIQMSFQAILPAPSAFYDIDTGHLLDLLEQLNLIHQGQKYKRFLLLKTLFLGGDNKTLNSNEFHLLLTKLPALFMVVIDFLSLNLDQMLTDENISFGIVQAVQTFKDMLFQVDENTVLLNHQNLIDMAKIIFPKQTNINAYGDSLMALKERLIGGDSATYTYHDLKKVLDLINSFPAHYYFNSVTFKAEVGMSPTLPNLPGYGRLPASEIEQLWRDYMHLYSTYHFFPDEALLQYFADDPNFNEFGINFNTTLFNGFKLLYSAYCPQDKSQDMKCSTEQIKQLMLEHKQLLEELKIWPSKIDRYVTELLTGTDLFQFHSNGDLMIGLDELTEYTLLAISSNKMGKLLHTALAHYCPLDSDDRNSIPVSCSSQFMYTALFEELGFSQRLPYLKRHLAENDGPKANQFLSHVIHYSRYDSDQTMPLREYDFPRIMVSLANIESMAYRFDKNRNNILDPKEIPMAFKVFDKTIKKVAGLKQNWTSLSRSVLLYILKYKKTPSIKKLLWFHTFSKKKKISANRLGISVIFEIFGEKLLAGEVPLAVFPN